RDALRERGKSALRNRCGIELERFRQDLNALLRILRGPGRCVTERAIESRDEVGMRDGPGRHRKPRAVITNSLPIVSIMRASGRAYFCASLRNGSPMNAASMRPV